MNLKKKTISGLFWAFFSQGGTQLIQFIVSVLLARLLAPAQFGLVGMATVFTGLAAVVTEMGVSAALIQKQELREDHYSSAFWLNLAVGLAIMLGLMAGAPLIANFYDTPALTPILRAISINFLIAPMGIVQQARLTRAMEFKKLAIRDIGALLLGGIAGVLFALKGAGAWSLVAQQLVFIFFHAGILWFFSPWRPAWNVSKQALNDIFGFSMHLLGFNVFNYFSRNVDYLLIGRFLGAEALGLYTLAYKLMLFPLQNISSVISRVMFPAFSQIQHDLVKVRENYTKLIRVISMITFPAMMGLFAVAPEFVLSVFGKKWEAAIPLIRVLSFCGLFQSIGTTVGTIFLSQGKPDLQFKMGLASTVIAVSAICLGLRQGLFGVALYYTVATIVWTHFNLYIAGKSIGLSFETLYKPLAVSFATSAAMLLGIVAMRRVFHSSPQIELSAFASAGLLIYGILLLATKQILWKGTKQFVSI